MKKYIMALDQGTTSLQCMILDESGKLLSKEQKELTKICPKPGWAEQNPMEIWLSQQKMITNSMATLGITGEMLSYIGMNNENDTTLVWNKVTGEPIYPAICWKCRRTLDRIGRVKKDGLEEIIQEKTGLKIDAHYSASKIAWILDNVPGARREAQGGNLLFGTVDTWLIWKLSKGTIHVMDYNRAFHTMLFDIHKLCWEEEILDYFGIDQCMLPKVLPASSMYGKTDMDVLGFHVPIYGIIKEPKVEQILCRFLPAMEFLPGMYMKE